MALQAAINDHKVHAHLRSMLLYAKNQRFIIVTT